LKNKKFLYLFSLGLIILLNCSLNTANFKSNELFDNQFSYSSSNLSNKMNLNINADNATQLNASSLCFYEINIYRFEAQNITFNYTDSTTNLTISGAQANYSWYKKGDISINGNGTLFDIGNGLYTLDFNTSARDIGEYIICISIKKENYTKPNMVVSLNIITRPTIFLSLTGTMVSLERGILFPVLFYLEDSLNGSKLNDLTISWSMGFFSGTLTPLGNGLYVLPFPTQAFEIGSNIIIIDPSSNTDYRIITTSIQIEITWEKIFGLDLPIFYSILIISIIIGGGITLYFIFKRLKKSFIIKKIDESLKKIEANQRPISTVGIKNKEQIYKTLFEKDWDIIEMEPNFKVDKKS